jgi:hypothetical protein
MFESRKGKAAAVRKAFALTLIHRLCPVLRSYIPRVSLLRAHPDVSFKPL